MWDLLVEQRCRASTERPAATASCTLSLQQTQMTHLQKVQFLKGACMAQQHVAVIDRKGQNWGVGWRGGVGGDGSQEG